MALAFPWEVEDRRQRMPGLLAGLAGSSARALLVPKSVHDKIMKAHSTDVVAYDRLGEVLQDWKYAGESPRRMRRLEVYSRFEGVWYLVLVQEDEQLGVFVLATFHRVYARKVESRVKKGYLTERTQKNPLPGREGPGSLATPA